VPVPSTELFLAGGDNSVRGYAQRSIGVTQASGALEPGRLQAVGSVEWQRPLLLNQQRSAWETTVFIDAGAVSDNLSRLRAKVGIGSGVRYRSPVGPLQLDLAYGLATRRLRLHMTLGFKF
jgi:translocation and assembly module TamA